MRINYIFLLVFLFVSCTHEKDNAIDLMMKQDACWRSIYNNERTFSGIKHLYNQGGHRPKDSLVFAESEKIVFWRREFIKNKTLENLMRYADSIEAEHQKSYGWQHVSVEELKQRIVNSGDSTDFFNLLYFATIGESELLESAIQKFGAINDWTRDIPSFKDKEAYNLSDTVYLTVPTSEIYEGTFQLDFSKMTCKMENSLTIIHPKIVKTGPYYLLMYRPSKRGVYKIEGEVKGTQEGNYTTIGRIRNEFLVE